MIADGEMNLSMRTLETLSGLSSHIQIHIFENVAGRWSVRAGRRLRIAYVGLSVAVGRKLVRDEMIVFSIPRGAPWVVAEEEQQNSRQEVFR
jgi:hypothetical protein